MVEVQKAPAVDALMAAGKTEEEEDEEEEAWLKQIEDVAIQFVCLSLDDERQRMGGGNKSPARLLSTPSTPLDDGPVFASNVNVAPQIARKLKDIGDDLDVRVKKEILEATSSLLSNRSIFQLGTSQFNNLCSGVLTRCSSFFRSGLDQVGAVYMTLGQLTQGVESTELPTETTMVARRLGHFTREYMSEVGLGVWIQEHGGLESILTGTTSVEAGDPVDIPTPEEEDI